MKQVFKVLFAVLIWIVAALSLTHLWLTHPEIGSILPERWWSWLDGIYGSRNAEEIADLEILVGFTLSSLVLGVLACVALATLNFVRRR